jgi:hypothetical protein
LKIDHDRALRKGAAKDELHSFALTLEGIDPSRALLQLVSMRNHVGNVDIDSRATGFEMKANREGFITSEAVEELRVFVRFCVDWATIYRDYYIKSLARQAADVSRKELVLTCISRRNIS